MDVMNRQKNLDYETQEMQKWVIELNAKIDVCSFIMAVNFYYRC